MAKNEPVYDSDIPPAELTATASVLARIKGIFPASYSKTLDNTNVQIHKNVGPRGEVGSYSPNTNTIQLGDTSRSVKAPDNFAFTALHEIMHARNTGTVADNSGILPVDRLDLIKTAAASLGFPSIDKTGNLSTEEMMATLVPGMDNAFQGKPLKSYETDVVNKLHSLFPNAVDALYFSDKNPEIIGIAKHFAGPRTGTFGDILDTILGQRTLDASTMQVPEDNPTDIQMRTVFGIAPSPIINEEKVP